MGPWAIALRGKRAPLDLLPHSGKPVTARKALYGRKRRNGASLRLAKPSLSPELRPRSRSGARFRVQRGFQTRGLRPHCRASCQNTPDSAHSGPIATILVILYGAQSTAREASGYCSWIYSECYLLLTCANTLLVDIRAKKFEKSSCIRLGKSVIYQLARLSGTETNRTTKRSGRLAQGESTTLTR